MYDTQQSPTETRPRVMAGRRLARRRPLAVRRAGSTVMARVVLQFAVPGLLVLLLVGLGAVLVFRGRSETEAVRDARQLTRAIGHGMIEPRLDGGIVGQDRRKIAALDRYVREKILPLEPSLVRVKLWTGDGLLIYSDEPRLIGTRAQLPPDELAALHSNHVTAEVSNLARPENAYERGQGRLLEVYLPLHNIDGVPVIFETYLHYSSVSDDARSIWLAFAPGLLGALLLLWVFQVPLAWSFARRLRRSEREREALLLKALSASEDERRRIARDLHDGVLQDLTGTSMTLAAALLRSGDAEAKGLIARAAASTRHSIREMRSVMVDIAPVNLREEGLEVTLEDLLARLEARGVRTEARIEGPLAGWPAAEHLVFRTAREALRSAQQRPGVTSVTLAAAALGGVLVLEIQDDGRDGEQETRGDADHAFEVLGARAAELGGTLVVDRVAGGGRRVQLTVPAYGAGQDQLTAELADAPSARERRPPRGRT